MKKYSIIIKENVKKYLDKKVHTSLALRLLDKIYKLVYFDEAVINLDIKKLKGEEKLYRLRVGKYRIIFEKHEDKLVILVIKIGSRGNVYK